MATAGDGDICSQPELPIDPQQFLRLVKGNARVIDKVTAAILSVADKIINDNHATLNAIRTDLFATFNALVTTNQQVIQSIADVLATGFVNLASVNQELIEQLKVTLAGLITAQAGPGAVQAGPGPGLNVSTGQTVQQLIVNLQGSVANALSQSAATATALAGQLQPASATATATVNITEQQTAPPTVAPLGPAIPARPTSSVPPPPITTPPDLQIKPTTIARDACSPLTELERAVYLCPSDHDPTVIRKVGTKDPAVAADETIWAYLRRTMPNTYGLMPNDGSGPIV